MRSPFRRLCPVGQSGAACRVPRIFGIFARSRRGVAAVEFALTLPFMILLMLGSIEVARLITFTRKIELVADTAVEMLSQTPVGDVLADADLTFTQGSTVVIFPQILQDAANKGEVWSSDIQITMSSVQFTQTSTSCTTLTPTCYNATVVWTSGPNKRPCKTNLGAVADTATPTQATLPTDLYGPGSIVVVDIVYTYTPLFVQKLFGSIKISRSAFLAPRYVPLVTYSGSTGTVC
jgi:Flp pilus assembly protein TadG